MDETLADIIRRLGNRTPDLPPDQIALPHLRDEMAELHGRLTRRQIENCYGVAGPRPDLRHSVRSMPEANYSRILIYEGVQYLYEPISFELHIHDIFRDFFDGEKTTVYTPDFWIPCHNEFHEMKPTWSDYRGVKPYAKAILFHHQHPDKVLRIIEGSDCRELQKTYAEMIKEAKEGDEKAFCGWEYSRSNLKTHPKIFKRRPRYLAEGVTARYG